LPEGGEYFPANNVRGSPLGDKGEGPGKHQPILMVAFIKDAFFVKDKRVLLLLFLTFLKGSYFKK
jgi:hypothetical protein